MNNKRQPFIYVLVVITIVSLLLDPIPVVADERPPGSEKRSSLPTAPTGLVVQDLTGSLTPTDLANALMGEGVTISNVTFTGAEVSSGMFSGGEGIIGFDAGVILSSGSANNVVGPNQFDNVSTNNGLPGDPDLDALSGYTTYDAAILEFNFVPNGDHISFQFVFASDEYNEYVNSQYNDVFGFFVNGVNCALVEGDPVSINTINYGNPYGTEPNSHPELYINNDLDDGGGSIDTEMDGLTKILTCSSAVVPNQPNHLKLAIADASDHVWDAAVFIKAASITTKRRPVIILPGMLASINWSCFLYEIGCGVEILWGWAPTAKGYYQPLITRLNELGYTEENKYLSILFYDWRKPLDSNIARLKQRIDAVKADTGQAEVDLVGHSLGGLVARAYIQSDSYGGDVAHLVTLGSPHTGAAKAYPYWQAAMFYEMGTLERIVFGALMAYYMRRELNPIPVYVLRNNIPSLLDILPTYDYLYEDESDQLIPESSLIHRNSYLAGLNADVDTLFNRVNVATFVGQDVATTERFYVQDRHWWEWLKREWDDGRPNWDREDEFKTTQGDGTVIANSAALPSPAYVLEFPNVSHTVLPGDNAVINAIFTFLDISVAPPPVEPTQQPVMIFYLDGPAQATVTDPMGRTLGPPETSAIESTGSETKATSELTGTIPGAEYIYMPGETFKLIIIPDPAEGRFEVEVEGSDSGGYALGLLDTFNPPPTSVTDIFDLWDISNTQIEPSVTTSYVLTYTVETSPTISLLAETPVIELPIWVGDTVVTGRAMPGRGVEIRDANTNALLGTGVTDVNGHFAVSLTSPLDFNQRIYPWSNGITGISVAVQAYTVFLPLTCKSCK
jgi:pimeloyl-ACP methyl ester carboxylesterase